MKDQIFCRFFPKNITDIDFIQKIELCQPCDIISYFLTFHGVSHAIYKKYFLNSYFEYTGSRREKAFPCRSFTFYAAVKNASMNRLRFHSRWKKHAKNIKRTTNLFIQFKMQLKIIYKLDKLTSFLLYVIILLYVIKKIYILNIYMTYINTYIYIHFYIFFIY